MLGWLVGYRERSAASGLACCSSFSKRVCLGLVQSSRVSVSAHMFCDSMLHHRRTRFSPTQLLLHRKNLLVNWSDFHQCRCHSHCRAWPQQYPLCIMYSACMQTCSPHRLVLGLFRHSTHNFVSQSRLFILSRNERDFELAMCITFFRSRRKCITRFIYAYCLGHFMVWYDLSYCRHNGVII